MPSSPFRAHPARSSTHIETLEERRLLASVPSGFVDSTVVTGLDKPTQMAFTPDGRLLVAEQGGKLRVVKNGALLSTPAISLTVNKAGERGFSGVVADPDFANNNYIYLYYTRYSGAVAHNRLSRFTMSGDTTALSTEKVLLDLDPLTSYYHMGGGLHFGSDGKLYVSVGENARGSPAQRTDTLLGKILRLNKDGSIPSDNPFYDTTTGNNRAIFSLGLRNPFTFAIQPGTQTLFINDVGEATWEEVNKGGRGDNFGWPQTEGPHNDPRFVKPIYSYDHSDGGHAVIGADFYPATGTFPSQYRGKYIFGDHNKGWIKVLDPSTGAILGNISNGGIQALTDLDVGPDGAVYYIERFFEAPSRIGKIQATGANTGRPVITRQPQSLTAALGQPATFSVTATGAGTLTYQWQRNGVDISGATQSSFTINTVDLSDDGDLFRVVVSNAQGPTTSNDATLTVTQPGQQPVPTIDAPLAGQKYNAGDTINFSGAATDPQDGDLPVTALKWEVVFHHDDHTHPFIIDLPGVSASSFVIPTDGEVSANVFFRIRLTATDADGNATTVSRDVFPEKSTLTVNTSVAGLAIQVDSQPKTAPYTFDSVVKFPRVLTAPDTQVKNGITYSFTGWSDGVSAATRTIVTPATDTTFTANYSAQGTSVITLGPAADTFARDGVDRTRNFGSSAGLEVKYATDPKYHRQAFFKFDLNTLGPTINSAKLRLFGRLSAAGNPIAFSVFGSATTSWTETGLTWANRPASTGAALATVSIGSTTGQFYELDVTSYLQSQRAAGKRYVTFVLKANAGSSPYLIFNSRESASNKPELRVG